MCLTVLLSSNSFWSKDKNSTAMMMFGALRAQARETAHGQTAVKAEETQSFLPTHKQERHTEEVLPSLSNVKLNGSSWPWKLACAVLTVLLAVSLYLGHFREARYSYEAGFETDLGTHTYVTKCSL